MVNGLNNQKITICQLHLNIKTYELLYDQGNPTGQQSIVYQGTSNEAINLDNPLKSLGIGDDWLQIAKLMNN